MENIQNLMAYFGDIQEQIPTVHIGGTNGKGSVGAMLSAALKNAGYRVGRFQTPDVFCYEEEFLINDEPIKKERLAAVFERVAKGCAALVAEGKPHPTRFEVETAAAFLWFYEEQVDVALLEVGMGGALDATNVIRKPLLSVLTSISMDHMTYLGTTLPEIAAVKAQIIKPGCPAVTSPQHPQVLRVLEEQCQNVGSRLYATDEKDRKLPVLGLSGVFQKENAACAWQVLELLQKHYPNITTEAILAGLQEARWPGRFEKITEQPAVYIDGAHNEDAAKKLRESVTQDFPNKKIIYIMGVLADKDYETMADVMFCAGDTVYTVTPNSPRALSAEALADCLREKKIHAKPCGDIAQAVKEALQEAKADDVVLAFGSLSYLGEVKKASMRMEKEKKYQYILWDLDGTIINSFEGVSKCVLYALEHLGIFLDEGQLKHFIGPPLRDSFPRIAGVPEEQVEEAVALYRERYNPIGVFECAIYPDVKETLQALQKAGYYQALASSKPEDRCRDILQKFQLLDYFDEVVGASMDGRIDTKIQVLQEAFRRMQQTNPSFQKETVVLIGDTKYDADGAAEAAIDCIGVSYGFGTKTELFDHGACAVYDDLKDLCKFFEE